MFFVEALSGLRAGSTALLGDSLDMLGDALAYGSSIYVLGKGPELKAKSAVLKGALMLLLAIGILIRAVYHYFVPEVPDTGLMAGIGILALSANLVCLFLLTQHRDDDINMRSVWICSRNDIIANVSVLIATGLVFFYASAFPDLVVGAGLAILISKSAIGVLREASAELSKAVPGA
jgi:Co/Zn/Cd efflux system component